MNNKLGFVGGGQIGGTMTPHLTCVGFSSTGYAPNEQSCNLAAKAGVTTTDNLQDAVKGRDIASMLDYYLSLGANN